MADFDDVPDLDLTTLNSPSQPVNPPGASIPPQPGVSMPLQPSAEPLPESGPTPVQPASYQPPPPAAAPPQYQPPTPAAASAGGETIQIAPHPTTNRFPWAPVENPKVPVYQAPPAAPSMPAAQPAPMPVVPPPPQAQPAPPQPVMPAPPPPPPAAPPIPEPAAEPQPKRHVRGKPVHIYSDYTREVWRVFRPSKTVRLMVLGFFILLFGLAAMFWLMNGAPTNIMDLPLIKSILQAE